MAKFINDNTKEFLLFAIIGLLMTFLNFLLLAMFIEIFSINYIISNILSYIIAVIISYFINVVITFKHNIIDKKKEIKNLIKYCFMKLLILCLDTICLYVLVKKLDINLYISKIILTIVFTLVSFCISKRIVTETK